MEHVLGDTSIYGGTDWLSIGLGVYMDREFTKTVGLGTTNQEEMMGRYTAGVKEGLDTTIDRPREHYNSIDYDFNNVVVHGKGYSIVSALNCVLGDRCFDRVVKRCLEEFGGRLLTVGAFQRLCEEESGEDLGWFFDQWVRSNRTLAYRIAGQKEERDESGFRYRIEVERLGDLEMPIPVLATFEDGTTQLRWTDRLLESNELAFKSRSALKTVVLDPNHELPLLRALPDVLAINEIDDLPWSGSGERALHLFRTLQGSDALGVNDWGKLGLALYDGGFYPEALEALANSAESEDKGSLWGFAATVWEGHILDLLGRRDEALERYREALNRDPGQSMQHTQYGMLVNRAWVEQRLETPFQRERKEQRTGEGVAQRIRNLPSKDAGPEAKELYAELQNSENTDPRLWEKMGMILCGGGYNEEALGAFQAAEKALEGDPWRYASVVWQGHVLDLMGKRNEAIVQYQRALELYTGGEMRHDQYGIVLDGKWIRERLERPFEWP
jgi:tetratricopeptide (TPR) repeat protein